MGASTMNGQPPPLPPGFVLDAQPQARPAQRQSAGAPPSLPPGFVLDGQDQGESWSPNDAPPAQTVDPRSIPTKGAIEPYDPSMAEEVGNRLYDSARAAGLPASRMRRDAQGLDAFVRGAADVPTWGLADEIAAAAGAVTGVGGKFGDYDGNLNVQRAIDERDEQLNPVLRTAGQVVGGALGATALSRNGLSFATKAAQEGRGWLARMLAGAKDGAIQGAGYGAGSGEGVQDRLEQAGRNLGPGALVGGGAEAAATAIGKGVTRLFRGAGDNAPAVANVAEAEKFGIPLSRAQATQSVPQTAIEDQLRSQGAMKSFDDAQREAVNASIGNVQERLAGRQPVIPTASAAYERVPDALRGVRDRTKAEAQAGYNASVNDPNVLVDGGAVSDIPAYIKRSLDDANILIDPMYHQGASRALQFVEDFIGRVPKVGGDVKSVQAQLKWVENLRSSLGKNFAPIGQDAPALMAIKNAINDWTDEVFEKGLVSASDDVLDALKQGRAKWSEYMGMVQPRSKTGGKLNPQYEAQAAVRRIMDKEYSPEEIGRHLFGTSVVAPKNNSFMTAQLLRKQLGPDSAEWSSIRQSFWLRATRAADEAMNPARIAKNIEGLLKGDGKGVAHVLYSEGERQMMQSYAGVMRMLTPLKAGINGSNTANRLMPQLRTYASKIMGALSGGSGMYYGLDPLSSIGIGAVATNLGDVGGAIVNASRASAATRAPIPRAPSATGGALLRGSAMPATPAAADMLYGSRVR
jgi:hypothetical protein